MTVNTNMKRGLAAAFLAVILLAPAQADAELVLESRIPHQPATSTISGASGTGILIGYRWNESDIALGWLFEEINFTQRRTSGSNATGTYYLDAVRVTKNIADRYYIAADVGSVSNYQGQGTVIDVAAGGRLLKTWERFSTCLILEAMYRHLDTKESLVYNGTATNYGGFLLNVGVGVSF